MRIRYALWHCAACIAIMTCILAPFMMGWMLIAHIIAQAKRLSEPMPIAPIVACGLLPMFLEIFVGVGVMCAGRALKNARTLRDSTYAIATFNRSRKEFVCPRSTATTP